MRLREEFDQSLVDFLESQGRILLRFSISLAENEIHGEEVFQKVVVATYGKLSKVAPEAWFSYLRTAIINQHRSNWRNQKPQYELSDVQSRPDSQIDHSTRLTLESALKRMEPKIREAVVLRYVMGYSIVESAGILGTNEMQIKNFCRKGLGILRVELEGDPQIRGSENG
jgi:RNA polymerase sigma factor (sigma-70 family)